MSKSAKAPVNDMSERLKNTRREVETLKADIEKLINVGIGPVKIPNLPKEQHQQLEMNEEKTRKKHETICSRKMNNSLLTNAQPKVPIQKQQESPQAPSKSKPYNIAETREYIKKQHEKRAKESKNQIIKTVNQTDLTKVKLKALDVKTREIVKINVQKKRERSKSRDKNNEIRFDRTKQPSTSIQSQQLTIRNRDRSKSREHLNGDQQKYQNIPKQQQKDRVVCNRLSRSIIRKTDLNRPEKLFKNITIRKNYSINNNNNNNNNDDGNIRIEPINMQNNNIVNREVLDHAVMTDYCEKETKETQTSQKTNNNSSPLLLIPQQQSHNFPSNPYNFINTVKRKLQFVVNDGKKFTDIGTQHSLQSVDDNDRQKLKDEIHELLVKRNNLEKLDKSNNDDDKEQLKSFISHQHHHHQQQQQQNLNLETVEKLKLIPLASSNNRNISKKLLFDDSGSDTSKNIPEISSESGVSSSRSTVINSETNLDLERLQNLKLQISNHDKQNSEIIIKSTKCYSSDFIEEIQSKSRNNTVDPQNNLQGLITNISNDNNSVDISTILNKPIYIKQSNGTSRNIDKSMYLHVPSVNLDINVGTTRGDDVHSNIYQNESTNNSMKETILSRQYSSNIPEESFEKNSFLSNIKTNKPSTITIQTNQNDNTNRIHLKFEAEVHLLNDFNKSFHRFLELEEAFQHLKDEKAEKIRTKIVQNNDTQTSFKSTATINTVTAGRERELSINYSRGSDITDDYLSINNKTINTIPELELSTFNGTNNGQLTINHEDYDANSCAGLSLNMFEQLIKDEDARLNHLKSIIKIREQILLDRTKSELVWLEIQKKQLVETGKVEEASLIKKKQRAILLKLEQERNEIKRLKQTQKQASSDRINKLKHQRNLIKSQLSTNEMLTNIKVTPSSSSRKNRRQSGPLIVTQNRKESIHSETSISTRKGCSGDDIFSITTTSRVSCISSTIEHESDNSVNVQDASSASSLHRNLSMREKALRERKRTAEELLKWHQKLLDEEKKITALEIAANVLVKQIPKKKKQKKKNQTIIGGGEQENFELNGKQLNQLWRNMTGRIEKKFIDNKIYIMSQIEFEKFCKSATKQNTTQQQNTKNLYKNSDFLKTLNLSTTATSELNDVHDIPEISGKTTQINENNQTTTSDEDIKTVNGEYSSEFELESVHEITNINDEIDKNQISSISELIHNFSKIEDEISVLGKNQEKLDDTIQSDIIQQDNSISDVSAEIPNHINIEEHVKENISEIVYDLTFNNQKTDSEQTQENDSNSIKKEEDKEAEGEDRKDKIENKSTIESAEISENVTNSIIDILEIEGSFKKIDEKFDESLKILNTKSDISEINFENSTTVNSEVDIFKTSIIQDEITNQTDDSSQFYEHHQTTASKIEEVLTVESASLDDENTTLNQLISNEILSEENEKHDKSIEESQIETIKQSDQYSDDFKTESDEKYTNLEKISESKSATTENEQTTIDDDSQISTTLDDSKKTSKSATTTTSHQIDVKKRVSEIMTGTNNTLRSDKSPRLQDIYITTYDNELLAASDDVKSEAEELLRKQIAIEQEIKRLQQQQQQKEHIPYMYVREIPNKPPPPYTPPSTLPVVQSILPSEPKEIDEITNYTSKVLYKAYELNNLENVKFSENSLKLTSKLDISKNCCELLFNICKELANEHYKQFKKTEYEPTWMKILNKRQQLSLIKPYDCRNLERYMNRKLKELFGFEKSQIQESMIIKWGRKKRDHVDEILIKESQDEDTQWTNFDKDELIIKDQLTDCIMDMLIDETVGIIKRIVSKKQSTNCKELDEVASEETQ